MLKAEYAGAREHTLWMWIAVCGSPLGLLPKALEAGVGKAFQRKAQALEKGTGAARGAGSMRVDQGGVRRADIQVSETMQGVGSSIHLWEELLATLGEQELTLGSTREGSESPVVRV